MGSGLDPVTGAACPYCAGSSKVRAGGAGAWKAPVRAANSAALATQRAQDKEQARDLTGKITRAPLRHTQVMCTGCLCTGKQLATEHDPRIDPF